MIREYVNNLAGQMGIPVTDISVVEGREVGCLDVHLLHIFSVNQQVSVLVYQAELDELLRDSCCERLEKKIRSALLRLEVKQVSEGSHL